MKPLPPILGLLAVGLLLGFVVFLAVLAVLYPGGAGDAFASGWTRKQYRGWYWPTGAGWVGFAIYLIAGASLLRIGAGILLRWRAETYEARQVEKGICLNCRYDLRGGTTTGRCPECGAGLTPEQLRSSPLYEVESPLPPHRRRRT